MSTRPEDDISAGMLTQSAALALREAVYVGRQNARDLQRLAEPSEELFPASVTSGASGVHAWTEQAFDSTAARYTRPGGRTGTAARDPARMPDGSTLTTFPAKVWLRRTVYAAATGTNYEVIDGPNSTITPLIIAHLELHLVQDFYWSVSGSMAYKPNDSNPANTVAVSLTGDLTGALLVAANGTFAGILFSGQPSGQATAQAIDQIDSARVSVQEVIFFDAKPPQLCWDTVSVYAPFGVASGWQFSGQVFNNWRGTAAHPASALTITLDGGAPFGGSTTVADPVSGAWGFTFAMPPASYTALRGSHVTATVVNNYGYCDSAQRAMP